MNKEKVLKKMYSNVVSNDNLRPMLCGVYHDEEGLIVATDAHKLVAIKTDIPAELIGKTIDKEGNELDGRFPRWRSVLPVETTPISVDFEQLSKAATLTRRITVLNNGEESDVSPKKNTSAIKLTEKSSFVSAFLETVFDIVKFCDETVESIETSKREDCIVIKSKSVTALIMGLLGDSRAENPRAYSIEEALIAGEKAEEERKAELAIKNTPYNKLLNSLKNISASKCGLRSYENAVLHTAEGWMVSTDALLLVAAKSDFDESLKGTTVRFDGFQANQKYPDWESLFTSSEMMNLGEYSFSELKAYADTEQATGGKSFSVAPGKEVDVFTLKNLERVLKLLKQTDITLDVMRGRNSGHIYLIYESDDLRVLVMASTQISKAQSA